MEEKGGAGRGQRMQLAKALRRSRLLYGVYAEVAKHRTWIDEKIAALHNFLRFPMKLLYQSVTSLTSFDKMIIEVKSRKIV